MRKRVIVRTAGSQSHPKKKHRQEAVFFMHDD